MEARILEELFSTHSQSWADQFSWKVGIIQGEVGLFKERWYLLMMFTTSNVICMSLKERWSLLLNLVHEDCLEVLSIGFGQPCFDQPSIWLSFFFIAVLSSLWRVCCYIWI